MANRDDILSAGAAKYNANPKAWNLAAAQALLESAGDCDYVTNLKAEFGRAPKAHGWPITQFGGQVVCLKNASKDGGWEKPDCFVGGVR